MKNIRFARRVLFPSMAMFLGAPSAHAVIVASWSMVTMSPYYPAAAVGDALGGGSVLANNYATFDLQVTLDAGDKWTVAGVQVNQEGIASGMFFNTPLGSNTRPNPAIVAVSPATAYDCYVDSFSGGVNVAGAAVGTGPAVMNNTDVNIAWGTNNAAGDPVGPITFSIARFTFSGPGSLAWDLVPIFGQVFSVNGGSNGPQPIPAIVPIPEPATLAALALAGALSSRRRH